MDNRSDIDVLREMVRIAEKRRDEELKMIEKINQYNLALIAFSGSFLSLMVTAGFALLIVAISGFLLLFSIVLSLNAVRPRKLRAVLVIDEDIEMIKRQEKVTLSEYLLSEAEVLEETADNAEKLVDTKKNLTNFAGILLALSLGMAYIIYITLELMPKIGTTTTGL